MFSNFKIGTRLFLGFTSLQLFIIGIGICSYFSIGKLMLNTDDIANSRAVLMELSQSNRAVISPEWLADPTAG